MVGAGWVEFEVAERFAVEGDDSDVEIEGTCSQIDADWGKCRDDGVTSANAFIGR